MEQAIPPQTCDSAEDNVLMPLEAFADPNSTRPSEFKLSNREIPHYRYLYARRNQGKRELVTFDMYSNPVVVSESNAPRFMMVELSYKDQLEPKELLETFAQLHGFIGVYQLLEQLHNPKYPNRLTMEFESPRAAIAAVTEVDGHDIKGKPLVANLNYVEDP